MQTQPHDDDADSDLDTNTLRMHIRDVTRGPRDAADGFMPVVQHTTRGDVESRYYPVQNAKAAVFFAGGAGGGFDTPVRGWLYPRLSKELQTADGIAALRVLYRHPADLEESVLDVLAGISFLEAEGVQ